MLWKVTYKEKMVLLEIKYMIDVENMQNKSEGGNLSKKPLHKIENV